MKNYKTKNTFDEDLQFGKQGENEVGKYLESKGLNFLGNSSCLHPSEEKYWDILCQNKSGKNIKFEVKTDVYVNDKSDTNNLLIEVSCSGKPSGISTTKADVWINYFANLSTNNIWYIKTNELKELIKKINPARVTGGYLNKCGLLLINRTEFRQYFKVETWSSKNQISVPNRPPDPYKVIYESNSKTFLNTKNPFDEI